MHKRRLLVYIAFFAYWMLHGGVSFHIHAQENVLQPQRQDAPFPISIGIDLSGILQREAGLENIQAAWDVWYEGLGKTYGISPKVILYEDLQAITQDFNAGKLDIVSTNALNYLRMAPRVETNRTPDIYGVLSEGQKMYQYLMLVRSSSGVSDLKALQGKTLIVRQGDETGQLYLNTLLLRNGQPELQQFFLAVQETESFSKAALSVFFKQADACLATQTVFETMVELNPQVGKQLHILDRSPKLANGVFFFHQQLSQNIKDIIIKYLLNLETSDYGRQMLLLYKIDGLVQFELSDLDSVKALLQEYETYTRQ